VVLKIEGATGALSGELAVQAAPNGIAQRKAKRSSGGLGLLSDGIHGKSVEEKTQCTGDGKGRSKN
jgi:hypothetical protein